jgi:hypothetical protein
VKAFAGRLAMTTMELIVERIRKLPEEKQAEVLDFVEFLDLKSGSAAADEDLEWSLFSLAAAMNGMESEEEPEYTLADLKERYE